MKAGELSEILGAELAGADCELTCISSVENISEGSLVPLLDKVAEDVYGSSSAAFLAKKGADTSSGKTFILADDPELALVGAINALYPQVKRSEGVHPSAFVEDSALLKDGVFVGAKAYVGSGVEIGRNSQIYPGVYIGDNVLLGENCVIYANASIYEGCTLGDGVVIHSGAVIGSDGFGYYQKKGQNIKIPHVASVVIQDDVEIGANSCVDRGKFEDTVIGEGTKIDNLVQIAHNVRLGKHNIFAGQSAISGSCTTGDNVMFGGRAATADHINICSKVMLGAGSGVISDIKKPGIYLGAPVNTRKAFMREVALVRDLPNIVKRISDLEKKIND